MSPNVKIFIDDVFISEDNDSEELKYIIEIIEKAIELDNSTYISIFEKKDFNISLKDSIQIDYSTLTNITQRDVWNCILQNNRITPFWKYVIDCWDEYGYSDTLAQFVKDNILILLRSNSRKISNEFYLIFIMLILLNFIKIIK